MFESYWSLSDGFFIGDRDAAEDLKFFMENKVTRVINCCASAIDNHWESVGITYLNYCWSDEETQVILDDDDRVVNDVFTFCEEAVERGEGILVQSFRGQSRAACVLAAYFMKKYRWGLQKTLEFLSFKCPVLNPNEGFLSQLEAYEQRMLDEPPLPQESTSDEADVADTEWESPRWEGLCLQNTYANCQRCPLADIQITKSVSSSRTPAIQFSEDIVDVKPYDVGSLLEGSPQNPQDVESRKPQVGKPLLKSAMRSTKSKASVTTPRGSVKDAAEESYFGHGSIVIHRRSGTLRCEPEDVVPKRFGVQLENKTILLEYAVPKYSLRAHHTMRVDLDVPSLKRNEKCVGGDDFCNTAIAAELRQEHEPWLTGVSVDQLARLVGRIRRSVESPKILSETKRRLSRDRPAGQSPR
jgi:protein-tyrosine phosphatase